MQAFALIALLPAVVDAADGVTVTLISGAFYVVRRKFACHKHCVLSS
jgi:hypothetical protein